MYKKMNIKNNGGFTMVELMVASAVFASGMAVLMGSTLAINNHQTYTDDESTGSNFNQTVLEFVQNQDFSSFEDVMTYDPGITDERGYVNIPGFGEARFGLVAIIKMEGQGEGQGSQYYVELGDDTFPDIVNPPNPIEVVAILNSPDMSGKYTQYKASTMINY